VLRILVFIECDLCNALLTQFNVAADPREASDELDDVIRSTHQIRLTAEEHGWFSSKDSTVHHCSSCLRPD
jgi:hypothetical protein